MSIDIKLEWAELPPRSGRPANDAVAKAVAELKTRPGCWAIVARGVKFASDATAFKRLGCETATRSTLDANDKPSKDLYARWPETSATSSEAQAPSRDLATDPPTPAPGSATRAAEPATQAPGSAPPAAGAAPSQDDLVQAILAEAEQFGITLPATLDLTDPQMRTIARGRIKAARDRARRNGR